MTRFARAKGSKSSNEKAPEDGTPWEVMKEQLLQAKKNSQDSQKRKEAENQRIENYENFLKEQKVQKRQASWCDFPEADQKRQETRAAQTAEQPPKKKKIKKTDNELASTESVTNETDEPSNKTNDSAALPSVNKPKKKKNKHTAQVATESETPLEHDVSQVSEQKPTKKKNKKKKQNANPNSTINDQNSKPEAVNDSISPEEANIISKKQKKANKKNKMKIPSIGDNYSTSETTGENVANNISVINKQNKIKALKKKKDKKLVDGKPVRRKEIDRSFQLIINGKEIELVRFDGFPVMKKDAERLGDLKSNMIKKGIPKSEVQRTMKLERRRAEKALARMKRDVCYNCRKGGHNLSDCPELKSMLPGVDAAEGVCFKCGSTEHRQFECKVQRDNEFRFATCFICKEQGHIARQCPDNAKGLYPNGGNCKLCGDVTHLRKDCPTANYKKQETSVKLQTLDSTENIEDIGLQLKTTGGEAATKKPKKIKF